MVGYHTVHKLLKIGRQQFESTASTEHRLPADMQTATVLEIFNKFERRHLNNYSSVYDQITVARTTADDQ
jgi:hypothetical protein